MDKSDDAAVYKINDELALVETLDFFTPIVDDPYTFGQIAAANSLSDIYAMGGEPLLAMNIVGFPNCLDPRILNKILLGGADKCAEANCLIVGGHTVQDDEPKYGLSVSALMHPDEVLTNAGAMPGDVLVLTKPLGVGIINTAIKGGLIEDDDPIYLAAVKSMSTLNLFGKRALEGLKLSACTDITGFGLMGHALEMAEGSDVTIVIETKALPILPGAFDYASMGLVPAGSYGNRNFVGEDYKVLGDVDRATLDILFDPQTSGGLLLSLPQEDVDLLMSRLKANSPVPFGIVGKVQKRVETHLIIT